MERSPYNALDQVHAATMVDDAEGDLSRWEYLTQTFDREDLFGEGKISPMAQEGSSTVDVGQPAGYVSQATAQTPSGSESPSLRGALLHSHQLEARVWIDASNTRAPLPRAQTIGYKLPSSNQQQQYPSQVGTQSLHSEPRMSYKETHATPNIVNQARAWALRHQPESGMTSNNSIFTGEESFDLEPFPLENWSDVRSEPSLSLNEAVHSFRRFSLSSASDPNAMYRDGQNMRGACTLGLARISTGSVPPVATGRQAASLPAAPAARSGSGGDGEHTAGNMCKPLSGYNYFYRVERDNIVKGMKHPDDPMPPPVCDFSASKHDWLLYQHWHVDPTREKRRHRRMHGKIEFSHLAKVISHRWKQLPEEGRVFYRKVAQADREQYDRRLVSRLCLQAPSATAMATAANNVDFHFTTSNGQQGQL